MGPIPVGVNKFVFEADAPKTSRIPDADILGVTVVLLTCSYDGREFVRVGYYVNNEYETDELTADPPAKPVIDKIRRNILADKPRVTRFAIKWYVFPPSCFFKQALSSGFYTKQPLCLTRDSEASAPAEFPPEQPEADLQPDDDEYGADELEEEAEEEPAEGAAAAAGESSAAAATAAVAADGDAEMGGVENENGDAAEEEESDDEGSVDLENESDDEEEEIEGEAAEGGDDAMEVDEKPAAGAAKPQEVMAH